MKNLTTRKILIGMLMALMLALGVPSIVDAVNDPNLRQSSSDFFKFRTPNTTFSISVSLSFDDSANAETVTITPRGGITLTGTFHGVSTPITLTESDADGQQANSGSYFTTTATTDGDRFSRSLSIQGRFNPDASGEQTVAIAGTDVDTGSWTYTYYYYVASVNGADGAAVTLTNGGSALAFFEIGASAPTIGYAEGDFGDADIQIVTGADTNPVLYNPRSSLSMSHANYKGGEKVSLLSGPISSIFDIHLKKNTSTDVVTAQVRGSNTPIITGVYIYSFPTLEVDAPTGTKKGSEENPGKPGEVIANAFTATVKDGKNSGVPGVPVSFAIPSGSATNGELVFGSGNTGTLVDASNQLILNGNTQITSGTGTTLYVRTNSSGKASVNCRLISGNVPVTVTAVGELDSTATVYTTAASGKQLTALSSRRSLIDSDAYDLFVLVTYDGEPVDTTSLPSGITDAAEFTVIFRTSDGTLGTTDPSTKKTAAPNTADGIAQIRFTPDDSSSNPQVTASLEETSQGVTRAVDTVTFDITGSSNQQAQPPTPPVQQRNRLTISTTGEGTTRSVTVNAITAANALIPGVSVLLSGTALTTAQTVTTGTPVSITLPSASRDYTLIATDPNGTFDTATLSVTVSAPGTLSLEEIGARATNGGQSVRVTVREADDSLASGSVNVVLSGAVNRTIRTTAGTGTAVIALPTTGGPYTVTLRATGYNDGFHTFSATRQTTPGTPTGPAGVADSIEIDGDRRLSGTVNQALRLRARVLDANDRGVSGVRVTFKILRPGGEGRLSQRGNGLATQVETDRNGYANATLTPLGDDLIVEAKAARVTAPVSFIIDVNGVSDAGTDTSSREPTETPSREISPEVLLGAAQRPPMVWVDSSGIYALVGASVGRFTTGSGVVMDIAVGGNKIYWTAQTGKNTGTINSANLDGTGAKQLVSIRAVPRGIAVDPVAKRLYWTNSQGWIQSSNLEGRARRNVISGGLEDPMGIAVSGGNMYWTQSLEGAPIERVNLMEGDVNRPAFWKGATPGTPEGLAIFGGKIYWTEKTGENSGTINRVNLNGEHPKQLVSIRAVPRGIAVDPVAERLYWTNSRGWVQSSDLKGRARRNVANGLGSPGGIVVNANIKAPAATPTKTDISTTASTSKYDINGDGTVDSTDVDALLLAVLAELTNAKYDVNGDGAVDVKDVREVNKNRGAGAAGAPALLGMKFSALEVDRLQEQIDLLIATNDRSPAAMRTLTYLQQLIVMARPDQTQLLANYPNPFNPETWIPYELATDTDVRITIYNAQGVVIRTLQLGQQSAGYYTDRERAAYWDGRNAYGEQVASGVYFYQLETDTMSALRKMVILK
jgi:hypothetical protein